MSEPEVPVATSPGEDAEAMLPAATPSTQDAEARRRQVRRAMLIGTWVWPAFIVTDAWMCFVAFPGAPFREFIALRVVVELSLLGAYRATFRPLVSIGTLTRWQDISFALAATAISLMATRLGGVQSSYMHGISIVALVRAAVIPEPWGRSWPSFATIGLVFPFVMAVVALIVPGARDAWGNRPALVVFTSNYIFVIASAFVGMMTCHLVWQAQQQVYRARRVGRYRLQAPIGKGGMGEVWLARDASLQRNVALKLLRVDASAGPEMVKRFEREALAASRLQSPHVIQIYDYGASDDGLYYITMEYLTGTDLQTLVEREGALPPARAVHMVLQACLALEVAHSAGVIHRDIKPHNLFVTSSDGDPDFVKLLDFGVVRFRESRGRTLTWTGMVVGTPVYLAPELWSGAEADERSDIYALGATLYFLLSARLPFGESTRPAELGRHREPAAIFPRPGAAERALESVVRQCLDADPVRRPPSARALHDALDALRPALAAPGPAA